MELFKSWGEIGGELKQENKDTSVVKLLDKTIGMLDKAMKAMDRFLKKKKIDVDKFIFSSIEHVTKRVHKTSPIGINTTPKKIVEA